MKPNDKLGRESTRAELLETVKWAEKVEAFKGITNLYHALEDIYGLPHSGCYRITFLGDDHVIKVPYNFYGVESCQSEERAYKRRKTHNPRVPVAKCRLIKSPIRKKACQEFKHKLLKMEKVTPVPDDFQYPTWCAGIDGFQVGYNPKGELVCYDP